MFAATAQYAREVIHAFSAHGFAALDPKWSGGRPRKFGSAAREIVCRVATTAPQQLGLPFTTWSLSKLVEHLARAHRIVASTETVRKVLREAGISWQASKTWKGSQDALLGVNTNSTSFPAHQSLTCCFLCGEKLSHTMNSRPVGNRLVWAAGSCHELHAPRPRTRAGNCSVAVVTRGALRSTLMIAPGFAPHQRWITAGAQGAHEVEYVDERYEVMEGSGAVSGPAGPSSLVLT
jgi:transposase